MGFPKSSDDLFTSNLLQPLNSNPPVEQAVSVINIINI